MKKFIEVFKNGSKTFYFAGLFLPKKYRKNIAQLYYYCRIPDDICDSPNKTFDNKISQLNNFLKDTEILKFFNDNNIPINLYEDLLEGMKSDLNFKQPKDQEEFIHYCYSVAGTVGIMMARMFNINDYNTLNQAMKLGIAMQITNILRDIEEDSLQGRIYIPKDLMNKYSVSSEQIENKEYTLGLNNIMKELSAIAYNYYKEGNIGIEKLPKDIRRGIYISSKLYSSILLKIEQNDFNPFKGRVYLSLTEKLIKVFT